MTPAGASDVLDYVDALLDDSQPGATIADDSVSAVRAAPVSTPDLLPEAEPARASDEELFRAPEPAQGAAPAPAPAAFEPEPVRAADPVVEPHVEVHSPSAEPIGLRSFLDEPAPAPAPEAPAAQSEPSPEPEAAAPAVQEPAPQEPEPEEAATEERHAVGSYASGANTYVMFSDGSIEADTPRGRFTFGSLDELKSFVNAGGEEARGAA